jgi:hypothetical protein
LARLIGPETAAKGPSPAAEAAGFCRLAGGAILNQMLYSAVFIQFLNNSHV